MKRISVILLIVVMTLVTVGCSAHIHTVGSGPAGSDVTSVRQWYVLFGLVPINQVDTSTIAGTATDYEIETQMSGVDFLITIFTGMVSVHCRTVTVTK